MKKKQRAKPSEDPKPRMLGPGLVHDTHAYTGDQGRKRGRGRRGILIYNRKKDAVARYAPVLAPAPGRGADTQDGRGWVTVRVVDAQETGHKQNKASPFSVGGGGPRFLCFLPQNCISASASVHQCTSASARIIASRSPACNLFILGALRAWMLGGHSSLGLSTCRRITCRASFL